ncbi:oligogalacturonide transporter [Fervidobacterium changbaicum]|uniref:MFS transporter n=1 Tax=Fervidobacterium changbaicum TaxID=310769 RepID=A0ABX5QRH9_9BACT|nr:glycoside-pentoside-hexuronide (GPH):cation symporter [Fervidobacterium changbaicum]QAV32928.1 MFS transporter [Fervidobacterium changbaicum]SDH48037.1 oligogalacturonide transporter [Fervidobacterium changbaicum]
MSKSSEKVRNENGKEKVPFITKFFFGFGDVYGGGVFNIINFFYAIFLTDVVKIPPAYASIIFLVGKIWDAVTDPIMGYISDRTKSRWGRRRPYFLFGVPFIFLSFVMVWYPVSFESTFARFLYALFSYMFLNTVVTMVLIPYTAMSAEITLDYNERTAINSLRLTFSLLSSLLCAVLPMMIVKSAGDPRKGYLTMSIIFGTFFALPYLGVFAFTKEKNFKPATTKLNFKELIIEPLKIKTFRLYLGMFLFAYLAIDTVSVIFPYYMKYYIGKPYFVSAVLGVLLITEIIFVPVYAMIARKKSKNFAYIVGALVWMVGATLTFFFRPEWPSRMLLAVAALIGAGVSAVAVMPHTILGDVTDVAELKFGERREGNISSMATFLRKVASALVQAVILLILGLVGYVNPKGNEIPQQPESVILAIRLIVFVGPILLLLVGLYSALKYPLRPEVHKTLVKLLEAKRQGEDVDKHVLKELQKELI